MSVELLVFLVIVVGALLVFISIKWFVRTEKAELLEDRQRAEEELEEVSRWRAQHNSLYREPTANELALQQAKSESGRKAREEQREIERRYEEARREGRRTAEFTKVRDQLLAGLEPEYDSAILSDDEIEILSSTVGESVRKQKEAARKWEEQEVAKAKKEKEVARITQQLLDKAEHLEFDQSLISEKDLEEIKIAISTEKYQWLNSRVRPAPQPYGVSTYGAERLVADWLVYLSCQEVVLTQASQDGGIDVETAHHVCQVKYYKNQGVSVQEVREIFGVASALGKVAMVFTSSDLTAAAYEFANQVGIITVQFNVENSFLVGLNYHGEQLLIEGEYE